MFQDDLVFFEMDNRGTGGITCMCACEHVHRNILEDVGWQQGGNGREGRKAGRKEGRPTPRIHEDDKRQDELAGWGFLFFYTCYIQARLG